MNKLQFNRILECTLLYNENKAEKKLNNLFSFKEIDLSKKVHKIINQNLKSDDLEQLQW